MVFYCCELFFVLVYYLGMDGFVDKGQQVVEIFLDIQIDQQLWIIECFDIYGVNIVIVDEVLDIVWYVFCYLVYRFDYVDEIFELWIVIFIVCVGYIEFGKVVFV